MDSTLESKPAVLEIARVRWQWLIPVGLFLLAVLLFSNTFQFDMMYSWDDNRYLRENYLIKDFSLQGIINIFTNVWFAAYIPVTLLSYAIEYRLWGMDPGGYHVVNVLLHAFNGALVYLFLHRLLGKRWVALLAAILFIVHPLQVESVAWIAERKNLLSVFFLLLTFLAHMRSAQSDAPRWMLPLSWFFYLCAALSKPSVVGAWVLLMIYDYFWARMTLKQVIQRNAIPFLIGVGAAIGIIVTHESGGGIKSYRGGNLLRAQQLMLIVWWDYVVSFLAPFNLDNFYQYPNSMFTNYGPQILGAIVLVGSVVALVWRFVVSLRTRAPSFTVFAIALVWLFMLPVSNIVPIAIERADRYMYVPSIVVFAGLGLGLARLWRWLNAKRRPGGIALSQPVLDRLAGGPLLPAHIGILAVLAVVIVGCMALTAERTWAWENEGTLWLDHLEEHPLSQTGWLNLGVYYYNIRDYENAIPTFNRLLEINPTHMKGNRFLGHIAMNQRRYEDAIPYYRVAAQSEPQDHLTHYYLGLAYLRTNQYPQAIAEYRTTIRLNPDFAATYAYICAAYYRMERFPVADTQDAVNYCTRAAREEPENSGVHAWLAHFLTVNGQAREAVEAARRATELAPDEALGYRELGDALREIGQTEEAIRAYTRALEINSDDYLTRNNLGELYADIGNLEAAEEQFRRAIQLNRGYMAAYDNLGSLAIRANNYTLARDVYRAAVERSPETESFHSNLCAVLATLNEIEEAVASCERAVVLNPDSGLNLGRLAHLYALNERYDEALSMARQAVEVAPDMSLSYRVLGDAYRGLDFSEEAIAAYRQALELDANNRRAREGLEALTGAVAS